MAGPATQAQRGFTYLAILFAVAISAVAMSGVLALWSVEEQREREVELLFVGGQLRAAIASYYEAGPGEAKRYPPDLAALLADTRATPPQRHLRRPYADPILRAQQWGLVRDGDGGVKGVFSLSTQAPLKRANFGELDELFKGKTSYAEWKFVYDKGHHINRPAVFLPLPLPLP